MVLDRVGSRVTLERRWCHELSESGLQQRSRGSLTTPGDAAILRKYPCLGYCRVCDSGIWRAFWIDPFIA